jgi:hypothetical protein
LPDFTPPPIYSTSGGVFFSFLNQRTYSFVVTRGPVHSIMQFSYVEEVNDILLCIPYLEKRHSFNMFDFYMQAIYSPLR